MSATALIHVPSPCAEACGTSCAASTMVMAETSGSPAAVRVGEDAGDDDVIGLGQRLGELVGEHTRARKQVWLEQHPDDGTRVPAPGGVEQRADLRGMMRVIVDTVTPFSSPRTWNRREAPRNVEAAWAAASGVTPNSIAARMAAVALRALCMPGMARLTGNARSASPQPQTDASDAGTWTVKVSPAAVGALMLGIDAHQRGAAQVPRSDRHPWWRTRSFDGPRTGRGRAARPRHLVIARHDDMSACMPRMVDERGAVMRLVAIMVEMVCERVRDHRDRGTVLAEAAVGFVRLPRPTRRRVRHARRPVPLPPGAWMVPPMA